MSGRQLLIRLGAANHAQLKADADRHAAELQKTPQAESHCRQVSASRDVASQMEWTVAGHDVAAVIEQLNAGPPAESQFAAAQKGVGQGRTKLLMAFSGQGAALEGWWLEAYKTDQVFKAAMERMCVHAAKEHDVELQKALSLDLGPGEKAREVETGLQQAVIYAVQVALTEAYAACGVRADAVIGHSFGEYAAAVAAGALSWEEGLALVITRGALMAKQPATGAMTAVMQSKAEVEGVVKQNRLNLATAGCNAPTITVLSGKADEVAKAEKAFAAKEVTFKRLATKHAFHSAEMRPMVEEFGAAAAAVLQGGSGGGETGPRFISTVSGAAMTTGELRDAGYWKRHVEATVNFMGAMQHIDQTFGTVLELGPQGALIPVVKRNMMGPKLPVVITASMAAPLQGKAMTNLGKAIGLVLSSPWGVALKDKHPAVLAPPLPSLPPPGLQASAPAPAPTEAKAEPPKPTPAQAAPPPSSSTAAVPAAAKGAAPATAPGALLVRLGGADHAQLKTDASKHASHFHKSPQDAAALCKQLSTPRDAAAAVEWTVAGHDAAAVAEQLNAGPPAATVFAGVKKAVEQGRDKLLLAFSGLPEGASMQGWWLPAYRTDAVFKAAMERMCVHAAKEHSVELQKALSLDLGPGEKAREVETGLQQAVIYAVQVALTEAYAACGVRADAVIGHSFGEYAAAVAAGALSWEEGLALVITRGALMAKQPATGAMTAVLQTQEEVEGVVKQSKANLTTAACDSVYLTVLSGPEEEVKKGEFALMTAAITYKRLEGVKHAFHSAEMRPMVEEFGAAAAAVLQGGSGGGGGETGPRFISTVSGAAMTAGELRDAGYWKGHVEATVNFMGAMQHIDQTFGTVLEVGPGASVVPLIKRNMKGDKLPAVLAASLSAPQDSKKTTSLCAAVGLAWTSPWGLALKAQHPALQPLQASSDN